jgi:hypothetical protein
MSAIDKILRKLALRQWVLTIIILCMSVWSAPAETLAQQAAPAALDVTEHSTLWSLEGAGSNKTPYLVLGMADRGDTPFYGLQPSAENAIRRPSGIAASANRADQIEPDFLVSSRLPDSNAGLTGLFLYGYPANYLAPEQRLANNESSTHEIVQAPRPFFELDFGSWRLPVMLSGAQSHDSSPNLR